MFIRIKPSSHGDHKKVQIVETIRQGNKVRQKIIRHVGTATDERELDQLKRLAEYAKAKIEEERQPQLFPAEEVAKLSLIYKEKALSKSDPVHVEDLYEQSRHIMGIHDVYGQVWKELNFDYILTNPARHRADCDYLKHMTMARIAIPSSKRKAVELLEHSFGVSLSLDRVYRLMDKIDETCVKKLQDLSFRGAQQTLSLFKQEIDVLFYDATTLYFESFTEDDLKQNGYSKDHKFNQPQVLLSLFVTKDGLPVGYEVFPGNTYEGHTLLKALDSLKERFHLRKVVFVADSGLFNKDNLTLLEEAGYEYIVGARLKNLPLTLQDQITNETLYQPLVECEGIKIQTLPLENQRTLLVSHSEKRAFKDREDRLKTLEKLKQKLNKSKNPESLISNFGYKKYLKLEGQSHVVIDEERLETDQKWDGLHGVITNGKEADPREILNQYKGLWQIEETFRVSKHDLKIRPIFHWTPKRVRAHIALCYMALCCVRTLEYRVKNQYQKLSLEVIRETLLSVQASLLVHKPTKRTYLMPSSTKEHAPSLYKVMGLKLATQPILL